MKCICSNRFLGDEVEKVKQFTLINASPSCAVVALLFLSLHASAQESWIATWTTSPERADPSLNRAILNLQDQTVRESVRISVGGSQIRIRLSNEFGSSPLVVGSVTVGVPNDA